MSFDALAQDIQRKKGSFEKIVPIIREMLNYDDINLEINSVFTPITVGYLSESMKFIIDLGVSNANFSLSIIEPWDKYSLQKLKNEMRNLRKIVLGHYKRSGDIPVVNFREDSGKGIFYCAAGKDRLAITPKGQIWGCHLFPDYFKRKQKSPQYQKFYFGDLDCFIENHKSIFPRISSNYTQLAMDNFSTPDMNCFLCPELENCAVCPLNASFSGAPLGQIPAYICRIQKIKIKEIKEFRKEFRESTRKGKSDQFSQR